MAKQRQVVSVHLDIAALVWATRGLNSEAEWAIWGRSFVEALATQSPDKNQFAAQLIGEVVDFRAKEAERIKELRDVRVQKVQSDVQTDSKKESKSDSQIESQLERNSKQEEDSNDVWVLDFDAARKAYPGNKSGLLPSLQDLKKRHKGYKAIIPLLLPAIEREKAHKAALKAAGAFCPEWKNFKTWINNSCWLDEFPEVKPTGSEPAKTNPRQKQQGREYDENITL